MTDGNNPFLGQDRAGNGATDFGVRLAGGKKTLLISCFFPPQIGGIENYYLNFCRSFDPDKVCVLAQSQPGELDFDQNQAYHIYRTDFFKGKMRPRWLHLRKTIKEIIDQEKIDQIVFGHFHPFNVLGDYFRLPYYIFGHGTDIMQIKYSWWQKKILQKVYAGCRQMIVNSDFLAKELESVLGVRNKIQVIYPGVDFERWQQPVADLAAKKDFLDIANDDVVMLSVGRLVPEKNFVSIIKAMPILLEAIPHLKYLIVGDGPEMDNLRALVSQTALNYKVRFIGSVDNDESEKALYYQLSHLFVTVSSQPEGFGIVYLEAQACRTPVVASKFGGSAEAVVDQETGILVDPNNQDEMIQAIVKIATDKELWEKMASTGQARIKKDFNWSTQMEKIKKILQ